MTSESALKVAQDRYFFDNETIWEECARRVGGYVADAEHNNKEYAEKFGDMIYDMDFLPGGRILRNARRHSGSMFNCYSLPIGDSIEEIGQFMKDSLTLWSEGGGVGTNLSYLRPKGALIKGKGGVSSGPTSFLVAADSVASTIESGGSRRAAGLACMNVEHPDINTFIDAKLVHGILSYFNISVAVTEQFLEAVESDSDWTLKFARQNYKTVLARDIWEKIVSNMIASAEPGLLHWDNLTSNNSYYFQPIIAPNPCFSGRTKTLTDQGYKSFEELEDVRSVILINKNNERSFGSVWCSGVKDIYEVKFHGNWPSIECTKDHVFMLNDGSKCKAENLPHNRLMPRYRVKHEFRNKEDFYAGFIFGDGSLRRMRSRDHVGLEVHIGKDDSDIADFLLLDYGRNYNREAYSIAVKYGFGPQLYADKKLPDSLEITDDFLSGLFSANGTIIESVGRVAYKTTSIELAGQLLVALKRRGINAYITTNKAHNVEHHNGVYTSVESYDVNIQQYKGILKFAEKISFGQQYKQDKLERAVLKRAPCVSSVKYLKTDKVYDFSEPCTHWGVVEGVVAHNCGEAPLEGYGVCNLGSLVLPNFITGTVNTNWKKLERVIRLSVRFLDDVIECNKYVLKEIDINAHNARRIGIGVMGLAEYLFAKKMRYGSQKAIYEVERLMRFIRDTAYDASIELASEKGAFSQFDPVAYGKAHFIRTLPASLRMKIKEYGTRNVTLMAIAPTGTISLLPEVTSGIEPLFQKAYKRTDRVGERIYIHPLYKEMIDKETPEWFVDTHDLSPEDHLEVQSAVQKYTDGAVSKTINMPFDTTSERLSALLLEYIHDLKGVTVYVDGSREGQILNRLTNEEIAAYIAEGKDTTEAEAAQCVNGKCDT